MRVLEDVDFEITDALKIFEKLLGADMKSVPLAHLQNVSRMILDFRAMTDVEAATI